MLQALDSKRRVVDHLARPPIGMAAGRQVPMRQLEQVLSAAEQSSVPVVNVLEIDEAPAGPQHASHLGKGPLRVGNGAQHVGAHDGVEAAILERELLGPGLDQLL